MNCGGNPESFGQSHWVPAYAGTTVVIAASSAEVAATRYGWHFGQ